MNADLYINDVTFKYNKNDSLELVFAKIADFSDLVNYVYDNSTGDIFKVRSNNFYNTEIYDNVYLSNLLFCNSNEYCSDYKEIITLLLSKLSRFENFECNDAFFDKIISCKGKCNGLVVLNKIDYINSSARQIISNINEWNKFHRCYLKDNKPSSIQQFLNEVKLYYQNLVIHEDNEMTMRMIYKTHYRRLLNCFEYLNDEILRDFKNYENDDFLSFINNLPSKDIFDDSSFEGKKKNSFYKHFYGVGIKYCEAHLKLNSDDSGKQKSYCRIYFSKINKNDSVIFVGIITNHL